MRHIEFSWNRVRKADSLKLAGETNCESNYSINIMNFSKFIGCTCNNSNLCLRILEVKQSPLRRRRHLGINSRAVSRCQLAAKLATKLVINVSQIAEAIIRISRHGDKVAIKSESMRTKSSVDFTLRRLVNFDIRLHCNILVNRV